MSLLVVFLMLAGTVVCSGKLLGVDFFAKPEPTNRDLLPPPDVLREMEVFDFTIEAAGTGLWQLTSRRGEPVGMLVCSLPYAEDVTGFSGPTPVWVYIDGGGRVRSIVPMDNAESARFFGRAIPDGQRRGRLCRLCRRHGIRQSCTRHRVGTHGRRRRRAGRGALCLVLP